MSKVADKLSRRFSIQRDSEMLRLRIAWAQRAEFERMRLHSIVDLRRAA